MQWTQRIQKLYKFSNAKKLTMPNQALSAVMTVQQNLQAASEQSLEDMDEDSEVEPLIMLGQQIEEQQAAPVQSTLVPMDAAPTATTPMPAPTAAPSVILPGLEFLTTPPSQPLKAVKLQLSGPMKFTTAMSCHATAINDQLVVLVVDNRVKSEIIDISLEDTSIEATLIFEDDEKIDIHPPIPIVMTYDIGVLRHFVFIRKHSGQ